MAAGVTVKINNRTTIRKFYQWSLYMSMKCTACVRTLLPWFHLIFVSRTATTTATTAAGIFTSNNMVSSFFSFFLYIKSWNSCAFWKLKNNLELWSFRLLFSSKVVVRPFGTLGLALEFYSDLAVTQYG